MYVPEGYKRAWNDDRFNPNRGRGTVAGQRQMEMVWTNTVPRRLINRRTGRQVSPVVTRNFDLADNSRVTVAGSADVAPTVSSRSATPQTQSRTNIGQPAQNAQLTPAVAASHRFVQVGTFADPGNANRAAARLHQAGLPARIGNVQSRGQSLQIVLAGPFSTQSNLDTALNRARAAGFSDAILKR